MAHGDLSRVPWYRHQCSVRADSGLSLGGYVPAAECLLDPAQAGSSRDDHGGAAVAGYILLDRRNPPRVTACCLLQLAMAAWVTLSILWAEMPEQAWSKWDWAFKVILFSAFIPFSIRSRVHIEAFAQVYVIALAANFVPFGLKTILGGGGYGTNLGLVSGNSGLAEGGLLSTACLMAVPLALFLGRHTQLLPRYTPITLGYLAVALLAVATAVGTYERSALVGLLALGATMFVRSRHKLRLGLFILVTAAFVAVLVSDAWLDRISTISTYQRDHSALTRLLIWQWTFTYAIHHPFGGGFMSYLINHVALPDGTVQFARAFHSIYFEMLGEQGWPGLLMFLLLSVITWIGLGRVSRRTRHRPHLVWCADLATALQSALAVFLTAGAFVGIAFQPMYWYMIALSISLCEYVRRVEWAERLAQPQSRWPQRAMSPAAVAGPPAQLPPWRAPRPNA
ncbi:MAG: putative O-glycosylation ligase, exosortase A system-associated [Rhodospirillales bacterium]|nr:putative O-glycosylation ligase, exosortase A system-associated [Rhodospirillales bacterium]